MQEQRYCKRLIEVDLPIKRISEFARREKTVRQGHISTLHIWWARRPLGACRAVLCASLWPDPVHDLCPKKFKDVAACLMKDFRDRRGGKPKKWDNPMELRQALLDFIAEYSDWNNSSNSDFLKISRELTRVSFECLNENSTGKPLVFDPFAGGGAIPLEALRIGADAFASDLNPVAILLNKAVLEYTPQYGRKLADEIRKWGNYLKEKAFKEVQALYPHDSDGGVPLAYIWSRTIKCEGPGCGCEVPIMRSLWLDKSKSTTYAVRFISKKKGCLEFEIITNPKSSDVKEGTSRRSAVTCPLCGYTTPRPRVEDQANKHGLGQRLVAVVIEGRSGRFYRLPNEGDYAALKKADNLYASLKNTKWFPTEELPYLRSIFNVNIYGIKRWGDLFSSRQAIYISTLARLVAEVDLGKGYDKKYSTVIKTFLAFIVDKSAMVSCNVARWRGDKGRLEGAFSMQALPMVWDWGELNPLNDSIMSFDGLVDNIASVVESVSSFVSHQGTVQNTSATNIPLPDDSAVFMFTDPPYYDSVPYANLSDFFYVWLRRMISIEYDGLFNGVETPKDTQIVQIAERNHK